MTVNYSTTFTAAKRKRGSEDSVSATYPSYMSTDKKIRTQQDWFSHQLDPPTKASCNPFGGQIYNSLMMSEDHPNVKINPRNVLMQSHVKDTYNHIQTNFKTQ